MSGYGFGVHEHTHVGQWGTQIDPPAHFVMGYRFVDEIELKRKVAPLVALDEHE